MREEVELMRAREGGGRRVECLTGGGWEEGPGHTATYLVGCFQLCPV